MACSPGNHDMRPEPGGWSYWGKDNKGNETDSMSYKCRKWGCGELEVKKRKHVHVYDRKNFGNQCMGCGK